MSFTDVLMPIVGVLCMIGVGVFVYTKTKIDRKKFLDDCPDMWSYFGVSNRMPQILPEMLLKRLLYRKLPDEIRGNNPEIRVQNTQSPGTVVTLKCGATGSDAGRKEAQVIKLAGNIETVAAGFELGAVAKIMFSSIITMSEALNLTDTSEFKKIKVIDGEINKIAEKGSLTVWSSSLEERIAEKHKVRERETIKDGQIVKYKAFGDSQYNLNYDNLGELVKEQLKNICGALRLDWNELGYEYEPSSSRSAWVAFGSLGIMAAAAGATAISALSNAITRSVKKDEFNYANIFVKFNEIVEFYNAR